ncbi:hypothetical protein BC962_2733 [Gillisia mitskevichiae]|uniref:YhhN-like protein n=1 Tax=Gillisia mitskevichiae TaxID=270921 RepID=A0A495P6L9_9FLAO|nr:hypothetical protein [Gillisia mitskevichiae]RKS45058.1 hypothetical protein BC962_2733 [Gillisia mitskevichiae]
MKNLKTILVVIGVILLLTNFYIILEFGLLESRWLRIIGTLILFSIFLVGVKRKEPFLILGFTSLLVSDILLLKYEIPWVKKLTFVIVIIAYLSFMNHIRPYVKNLEATVVQKVLFVGVLGINIVMLYLLIDMAGTKWDDSWHIFLFYVYGIAMIAMVILGFSYSNRYSNKSSFYFLWAVLGLVISDISGFMSYYLNVEEFFFPDRMFYIIGLLCLVKFSRMDKNRDMLESYKFL